MWRGGNIVDCAIQSKIDGLFGIRTVIVDELIGSEEDASLLYTAQYQYRNRNQKQEPELEYSRDGH